MKCPVCGAAELIHDTRDLPYTYKGETTVIAAVTGDFCRVGFGCSGIKPRHARDACLLQAGERGHR